MTQEQLIFGGVGIGSVALLILVVILVRGIGRGSSKKLRTAEQIRSRNGDDPARRVAPLPVVDQVTKQEAHPNSAPTSTSVIPTIETASPTNPVWKTRWGPLPAEIKNGDGFVTLPTGMHAVSDRALPTSEGDTWICEFSLKAAGAPLNGAPVTAWVGPLVLDAGGEVLTWWIEQPTLIPGQPPRPGSVEVTAPVGAVSVCIGVQGCHPSNGFAAADVAVEFTDVSMWRK